MDKKSAEELLKRYRLGILTKEEQDILESWYLFQAQKATDIDITDEELDGDLLHLSQQILKKDSAVKIWYKGSVFKMTLIAASIISILTVATLVLLRDNALSESSDQDQVINFEKSQIIPGDKRAILTLSNNKQVVLDSNLKDDIETKEGILISRTKEGRIVFKIVDQNQSNSSEITYNTISTPNGGEYEVQLIDGSRVWLNSMSSIRFPTNFQGGKRQVEITGEAYFEVIHNPKMPFHVTTGKHNVEVLGTHFSINAYENEIKTSLLEGSVKVGVEGKGNYRVLNPGDQSTVSVSNNKILVKQVDMEQALAWKNGYFIFDNDELKSIMYQIVRWYDVEVEYMANVQNVKLGGAIARKRNLKDVLDLLEMSANVKFKIEGRKVIVSK